MKNNNNKVFTKEHAVFIKKVRIRDTSVIILRILLLAAALIFWELAANYEIIDSFIFSSPSRIINTIGGLYANGKLFYHVWVTLSETMIGFAIATIGGTLFAVLLWGFDTLRQILDPYIVVLNSLPKVALGPIIIIWFGAGQASIVVMAILVSVIITVISMLTAFVSVDKDKILLFKAMGATKTQMLFKLILPHSLPSFISILKINVGMAWVGTIMGEFLVSRAGLGHLIDYGRLVFNLDLVMSAIVILGALAGIMYFLVALLEKLVVKWKW